VSARQQTLARHASQRAPAQRALSDVAQRLRQPIVLAARGAISDRVDAPRDRSSMSEARLESPMRSGGNRSVHGMRVVLLSRHASSAPPGHDRISREHAARRLADLLGYAYGGEYSGSDAGDGCRYFVPDDTLLAGDAERLGIRSERDVFGGVVPHAFVATKAITHGLVAADAQAPHGWSRMLADRLRKTVLHGFTAFSRSDALRAAADLLRRGPIRLKQVVGAGGTGQFVARDLDEFAAALGRLTDEELATHGAVVEQNLDDAQTFSIGQLHVGGRRIAYHGVQRSVRNHRGEHVYGGSDLAVVRGGIAELARSDLPALARRALARARRYDAAIADAYPGFFASRRNYDVACGRDADGRMRVGVLEQSWRFGGASMAEIAALQAFEQDPALRQVRVSTYEIYGEAEVPPGAIVSFRGVDAKAGALTKYCTVEEHGYPA
jgi:hypothetical protein